MSKYARDRRIVERGHNNWPTITKRNRKASQQYSRWHRGLILLEEKLPNGRVWYTKVPSQTIIHKGRKP